MLDIKELNLESDICEEFWDSMNPEETNLPVDLWIDNNQLFPEKRGFWFKISKSKKDDLCSYIDTDGNFYHNLDDFYLSANELQQIIVFARKYKDIIDELYECEDFYTNDFIYLLRYEDPFVPNNFLNLSEAQSPCSGLDQLRDYRVIAPKYTNLPVSIWIDNGHIYPLSEFEPEEKDALYNFETNNKYAIQALSDGKITPAFFKTYCIPGGEKDSGSGRSLEDFTKWEIEKPKAIDFIVMKYTKDKKYGLQVRPN